MREEDQTPVEAHQQHERPTRSGVFEFLFPGNKFEDLPKFDPRNINTLWKLHILDEDRNRRRMRFVEAVIEGKEFGEREKLTHPDQISIAYYLRDLIPLRKATHPTMFEGHSFVDLVNVENGERIGGVATRPVSLHDYTVVTQLSIRMRINPYVSRSEIILGVLDRENKPTAIIHFGEGSSPRRPKRVPKPLVVKVGAISEVGI